MDGDLISSFASAHPARIASLSAVAQYLVKQDFASAHPARIASLEYEVVGWSAELCLSTSRTDCISKNARIQCYEIVQCAVRW